MCRYRNLILAVALVCAATLVPEGALAQITARDTGAMTWERADTPGFPEGAMRKLLKIDQETGIGAALRWHPEGYVEPRHYHTTAAHSIYVLEGKLDVGGVQGGPGHFFYFPGCTAHGPMVAMEDSVFLIWTEGPLDLQLGDPPNGETPEPVGCRYPIRSARPATRGGVGALRFLGRRRVEPLWDRHLHAGRRPAGRTAGADPPGRV
jgi:hypothetical protein